MTRLTALLVCLLVAHHAPARADSLLRSSVSVEPAHDVAVDAAGFIYTLGSTGAYGTRDIVVRRYTPGSGDPIGVFTFGGSGDEEGIAVAVVGDTVYVTGHTYSYDLPVRDAVQPYSAGNGDAFVAAFASDGTIRWATYLGGYATDRARAMAVSTSGTVYLLGSVSSLGDDSLGGLPTTGPPLNVAAAWYSTDFVAGFHRSGKRLEYLRQFDASQAISVDAVGGAYVSFADGHDMAVMKVTADGEPAYTTVLGRAFPTAIAADGRGNVYVSGVRADASFPTRSAPQPYPSGESSAILAKLNTAGAVVFSTFLGGESTIDVGDLTTDAFGSVYLVGSGRGLPTLHEIAPPVFAIHFVVKVRADGAVIYSTPLGHGFTYRYSIAATRDGELTVLGTSSSHPEPADQRFEGTFLARLGEPGGTDVSLVASVSNLRPRVGERLSYVGTVLTGADAVDWTTLRVTLPADAIGIDCTAAGALSCSQTGTAWVATFPRLPAFARRQVVLTARGTCPTLPGPEAPVRFDVTSSSHEEPQDLANNHREVRLLTSNDPPTVSLALSTYRLPPTVEGLYSVELSYAAADDCYPPSCTAEVDSDDPAASPGDWQVVGANKVLLRSGPAFAGRIYEVRVRCVDDSNNATIATAWVQVDGSVPPPEIHAITGGFVRMYSDPDTPMYLDIHGAGFSVSGYQYEGFSLPCSTCDADLSKVVTFDGLPWFTATIGGRVYYDVRLAGAVTFRSGLVALDDYYAPDSLYPETRGAGHFVATGRLSGFTSDGARLFDVTVAGGGSLEFGSWGLATLELTFEEQAITPVIPQRLRVRAPSTAVVSSQPGSTQRIEWTYTGGATAFQIVVPGGWWSYTDNVLLTVPRRQGARQYADVAINAEYFESALLVRAVGDSAAFDMTAPIVRLPWQVSGATSLSKRGARWALPSSPRLSAAP